MIISNVTIIVFKVNLCGHTSFYVRMTEQI